MSEFKGSFEDFRTILSDLGERGSWSDISNGKQFKTQDGGILNWFSGTGKINFQGSSPARERLQQSFDETSPTTAPSLHVVTQIQGKSLQKVFVVHGHDTVAREQLNLCCISLVWILSCLPIRAEEA